MAFMKANILFKDRVSLPNLDIEPCEDEDFHVLANDTTAWIQQFSVGQGEGRFNLKLHHSIYLSQPYFIQSDQLDNGEPKEIVFTQFHGTGENVVVHFR